MKKYITLLILSLILLCQAQEKQWKRVADLPDIDEAELQKEPDPEEYLKELEDLFNRIDPSGNRHFTKEQYKEILKDLTLGTGRREGEFSLY